MRKIFTLIILAVLAGCGSGGSDYPTANAANGPVVTSPRVYNLTYSPQSAAVGTGTATVTGSVTVDCPEGDIGVIYILGGKGEVMTGFNPNVPAGTTRATIAASFTVSTATAGVYPFTVEVLHKTGMQIGHANGTFTVQ